jgi:ATP-dependent helicase/nuclease subunit B
MVKATNPGKDVIPAAALYYHISDPILLRTEAIESPEEWQNKISSQLKTKGVVNGSVEVVRKLDSQMEKKSDVVPIEYDSSGEISKKSSAYQKEELDVMLEYASKKIAALGREIMTGQVSVNPYETKDTTACAYCPYQAVCKLDSKISGFQKRKLPELTKEQVLNEIIERREDL